MTSFAAQRARMVDLQLRRRGIGDERVLAAMAEVPREAFVPEQVRPRAYDDAALPIGSGQTISQPWIVAATCEALALRGSETVLEIGGGSGYTAAVLAELAARVISIEIVPDLAARARAALLAAGYGPERAELIVADGSMGHAAAAPYPAIAIHAASPGPPLFPLAELAPGGRLVAPISVEGEEMLSVFTRDRGDPERYGRRDIAPCRFVPLRGEEGFPLD